MINVPLSDLDFSPANHRKTGGTNVDDLVASIRAHGLLQNLTIVQALRGAKHQVIAGGRRLRALRVLHEQGHIEADWPVPCNVVAGDEAGEASLTENVSRQAMHPADEFDAFSKLADEGASVGDIAARFGKTERYVQQRMRLAHVAPPILQEYRDGKATLEQMMALAITEDQDRQLRVWKAARDDWQRSPDELRDTLVENDIAVDSGLGKFVGIDAYENAGGVVKRDLFGDDKDSYLTDSELVQKLALEKLERTAEKIRKEGWAWVETRIEFGYDEESKFGTLYPTRKGSKEIWTDEQKQHAGVMISVAHNGQTELQRGLVKPEDRKEAAKATRDEIKGGRNAPAPRKYGDLSFAAIQRLQAECGLIVAGNLTSTPAIAIALLTAHLAERVLYSGYDCPRTWVHIARAPTNRMPGNIRAEIAKTSAGIEFERLEKSWRDRLPKKRSDARAWILAQPAETVQQLLAFLVAREIDVVDQVARVSAGAKQGIVDLVAAAGVDLAQQWKPSAEWLSTLPKATVLAQVKEAGADATTLAKLEKQPKAALADAALQALPPGWLPKPLRPAVTSKKKAKRAS